MDIYITGADNLFAQSDIISFLIFDRLKQTCHNSYSGMLKIYMVLITLFFHPPSNIMMCIFMLANYNPYRNLPSVRRYMLLSQRCGWSNLK